MAPTLNRADWIKLADRKPPNQTICLISDGKEIGLAEWDTRSIPDGWWNPVGFGGYEWEWGFTPTHWMPLSVELP